MLKSMVEIMLSIIPPKMIDNGLRDNIELR